MKWFLLAVIGAGLLYASTSLNAAGLGDALGNLNRAVGPQSGTGLEGDLSATIGTVIKAALALVGTVFLILTIYAGILWMTAQGKEDIIEKAKNIITAAIIGLFITLSAYAITYFVTARLSGGGASQFTAPAVPTKCGEQKTVCFSLTRPDFQKSCQLSYGKLDCKDGEACCKTPVQ